MQTQQHRSLPSLTQKRKRDAQASDSHNRGAFLCSHNVSGHRLDRVLESLQSALNDEIGSLLETTSKKIIMRKCKDLFCIGINDVTRTLEKMPRIEINALEKSESRQLDETSDITGCKGKPCLHAVLVAVDAHPRLLVGHLPTLAASRGVPFFAVNGGNGTGSMKLGAAFRMRTALAVGVKVADSSINKALKSFIDSNGA